MSSLVDHFRPLLERNGVSVAGVAADWLSFRGYCEGAIQCKEDAWQLLLIHYRTQFPNLAHLVEILLVFPVSNAKAERGFSAMRRIKTDWRSRLAEDTLDHLMRITINGCPVKDFDPKLAVQKFFSTARRPDAALYGPRKRKHQEAAEVSSESDIELE